MNEADDLRAFLDHGWQRLSRGVADRRAGARHPVLATVSPEGWPEARTVVLRAANRAEGWAEVHTDPSSAKLAAVRHNPRAQLHVWDPKVDLQIRLYVQVHVLTGDAVADRWAQVPEGSRQAYGKSPAVGAPIAAPFEYTVLGRPEDFAVLVCAIARIDLLELGTQHRRAVFEAANGWSGQWLSP